MHEPPDSAIAGLAKPQADRPLRCRSVVAEPAEAICRHRQPRQRDKLAEALNVPRVQMAARQVWPVASCRFLPQQLMQAMFLFIGHEEQSRTARTKKPVQFL